MHTGSYSDKELFALIHQSSETAFATLMERYGNKLYSQAIVYLKDAHRAQDVVQDIFLAIWKDREKLLSVESPADYLFIIARNKIANEARKRMMLMMDDRMEALYEEKHDLPDRQLDAREARRRLQEAVGHLPPKRRQVFELSRTEGLSYEEIASRLGISRETVKVHMVKALAFLRRYMRYHITVFLILKKFF